MDAKASRSTPRIQASLDLRIAMPCDKFRTGPNNLPFPTSVRYLSFSSRGVEQSGSSLGS